MNKILPKVSAVIIAVIVITGVVSTFMIKSGFWTSPTITELLPTYNLTATITNYTLTVNSTGATTLAIIGAPTTYGGTTNYSKIVASGTTLTLTAPGNKGYAFFSSWTGCNSVSGRICTVTMNASRTVTVKYVPPTLTVKSTVASAVAIIGNPTTYSGTTNYIKNITNGNSITLTAPATTSLAIFSSWTGCNSVSGRACNLAYTSIPSRTVTANYTPTLTVNSTGATTVAITGYPSTYSGTTNYSKIVANGTVLTLTAPATKGYAIFSSWTGCNSVSGTGNRTCNVTFNGGRTVTANYTTPNYTLTINSTGATTVAITGYPSTYSGTTNYSKIVANGTVLTLTAPATKGYAIFSSWTGCNSVSGTGNRTCNVTVIAARTVTAKYAPTYTLNVNSLGSATSIAIVGTPTTLSGITNYIKTVTYADFITLTAPSPVNSANFKNWSGCDNVNVVTRTCTLTIYGSRTVTANYY